MRDLNKSFYTIRIGLTNCYLIRGSEGYILIDTGVPNKVYRLWNFLKQNQIDLSQIKLIVLTHSHYDHVGNVREIKKETNAKVLIHEREATFLQRGESERKLKPTSKIGKIFLLLSKFMKTKFDPVDPDIVIKDTYYLDDYGIEGKVIHTPGHTIGSISVILQTGEAFVGDLVMNRFPSNLFSYAPIFADDLELLYKSWEMLLEENIKVIYPAHGKPLKPNKLSKGLTYSGRNMH